VHFQSYRPAKRRAALLARKLRGRHTEVVDVGPLLLHALFASDALSAVLPEQVPRHVRFVAVGYAALVAVVVELVLPDVHGQLGLVAGGLEAHLARHMALAQVYHQPE
jgi:hypothetical protein